MRHKTNAQETRILRKAADEARPQPSKRIRHLHSKPEAQASQVKALGSHGRVVAPALQAERDMLFEKWLRAYDNYNRWLNDEVNIYCTNYAKDDTAKRKHLHIILKRHADDLSEQLQRYDERINAAKTTGPLLY